MGGWVDGWIGGWVDGWMGGWVMNGGFSFAHYPFSLFSFLLWVAEGLEVKDSI
jgi:hypothetical protein